MSSDEMQRFLAILGLGGDGEKEKKIRKEDALTSLLSNGSVVNAIPALMFTFR